MKRHLKFGAPLLILLAAVSIPARSASAQIIVTPGYWICAALKSNAAGKYLKCREQAESKYIKLLGIGRVELQRRADALAKCLQTFSDKWTKIESKHGIRPDGTIGSCNGLLDL